MENISCIRVLADPVQIKNCKDSINRIQEPIKNISKVLHLSGNVVRLKILFLLHMEKEMCPCDLSDVLAMTVPAISQHLRKLKDGGIVRDRKIGQTIFYSIVRENAVVIQPILEDILNMDYKEIVK